MRPVKNIPEEGAKRRTLRTDPLCRARTPVADQGTLEFPETKPCQYRAHGGHELCTLHRSKVARDYCAAMLGDDVRVECPECGSWGPHETNGDQAEPWMSCRKCRKQSALPEVKR